ncbi:MAG: DUF805 domain-containing protein [Alphaproteobacteria bacterium]|nr:DUF805 domain-containing protein [Alphaproteobacteria bacterium]
MDIRNYFFTWEGRVNRAKWWLGQLILMVAAFVVYGLGFAIALALDLPALGLLVGVLLFLPILYAAVCLSIKRFHDRDKSGWWVCIQFVPLIGPFWYLIECGMLRGTVGPNRFGDDPLE